MDCTFDTEVYVKIMLYYATDSTYVFFTSAAKIFCQIQQAPIMRMCKLDLDIDATSSAWEGLLRLHNTPTS